MTESADELRENGEGLSTKRDVEGAVPYHTLLSFATIVRDGGPYRKCVAMHKVVGAIHDSPEKSLPPRGRCHKQRE